MRQRGSAAYRASRLVRVRVLRIALPALAAVILAAVAGQLTWRGVQVATAPQPQRPAGEDRMIQPSFSGEARDGSRYLVRATSGVRDPADPARILLQNPMVSVDRAGEPAARSVSERGVYREDDATLTLQGNVRVDTGGGFGFAAQDAVVDTRTGQLVGQRVRGRAAVGEVTSDNYTVTEKGDRMVFKGGVRARLNER